MFQLEVSVCVALGLPIFIIKKRTTEHPVAALPEAQNFLQPWVGASQSGRSQHMRLCGFSIAVTALQEATKELTVPAMLSNSVSSIWDLTALKP